MQFVLNGGEPVASSVPATEHSVMTAWPSERAAIDNMIDQYGDGLFACVMDSYDYAEVTALTCIPCSASTATSCPQWNLSSKPDGPVWQLRTHAAKCPSKGWPALIHLSLTSDCWNSREAVCGHWKDVCFQQTADTHHICALPSTVMHLQSRPVC